jgi:hypothetical protein
LDLHPNMLSKHAPSATRTPLYHKFIMALTSTKLLYIINGKQDVLT